MKPRQVLFRDDEDHPGPVEGLDFNVILESEFDYAAQTAFQAQEDRSRVSNFFLISLGGMATAVLSPLLSGSNSPQMQFALAVLFLALAAFGLLTILQLIRLRQAWFESVRAMQAVKNFYMRHCKQPGLEGAFLWGEKSLPQPYKPWSVAFLLVLQVALVSGISFGLMTYFSLLWMGWISTWLPAALGAVYILLQMVLYRRLMAPPARTKKGN